VGSHGERVALLVTVRRSGSTPLITVSPTTDIGETARFTEPRAAIEFVASWLAEHTTPLEGRDP
jgi:hypothetical protein